MPKLVSQVSKVHEHIAPPSREIPWSESGSETLGHGVIEKAYICVIETDLKTLFGLPLTTKGGSFFMLCLGQNCLKRREMRY